MTFSITAGWWLAPIFVTIISFGYAKVKDGQVNPGGNYGSYGSGFVFTAFAYGFALIVSLVSWLVWSFLA